MKYRQLLLGITAVMSLPLSIQAQTMDQMESLERAKEEQIERGAARRRTLYIYKMMLCIL